LVKVTIDKSRKDVNALVKAVEDAGFTAKVKH
jgi:copper chaperone CopZ